MDRIEHAQIMLSLCRAVLLGETPEAQELGEPELEALYALSYHHDCAHLVSRALYCAGKLDAASATCVKFQKAQMLSVFRYEHQRVELERLCEALEQAQVAHIPLKGSVLRALYPEPWMRTSTDIDVLVHPDDLSRAEQALTQCLGYQREAQADTHDVSMRSESGVHIELHFDLIEQSRLNEHATALLRDIWSHAHPVEGKAWQHELTDEMFYFYHIAHMAKHFADGGCGVRTLIDLWLLCHRKTFDAQARATLLEQGGLAAFERAAVQVCECWMTGETPSGVAAGMADFVLRGGSFGNTENFVVAHQSKSKSKLRYAWERVFMPYEQLATTYYPSLRGRRYLTPLYQLRRLGRLIFGGKLGRGVRELHINATADRTHIGDVASLFEHLGI